MAPSGESVPAFPSAGADHRHPVPAAVLRFVQRAVRERDQRVRRLGRVLVGRGTDADGDRDAAGPVLDGRLRHGAADPFGGLGDVVTARPGQEDQELLATVADQHVALADDAPADPRDGAQDTVADEVAVCVVDGLEVVDVEHEDAERTLGADGPRELLAQAAQPEPAVVGVGERIDRGQSLETVMGEGVVHRQAEVGPEVVEQLDVVALERARGREHDHAERHALERDRDDEDLPGGDAHQDRVHDKVLRPDMQPLDLAEPDHAPHMVVGGQVLGCADAVARERDEPVLPDDKHRAGLGCGVPEEAVQRRRAEPLELELARQDAAEVVDRGLHRVALRKRRGSGC